MKVLEKKFTDVFYESLVRGVTTVSPDIPAGSLLNLFGTGQAVVVVNGDRVLGILTKLDLIEYLAARLK